MALINFDFIYDLHLFQIIHLKLFLFFRIIFQSLINLCQKYQMLFWSINAKGKNLLEWHSFLIHSFQIAAAETDLNFPDLLLHDYSILSLVFQEEKWIIIIPKEFGRIRPADLHRLHFLASFIYLSPAVDASLVQEEYLQPLVDIDLFFLGRASAK